MPSTIAPTSPTSPPVSRSVRTPTTPNVTPGARTPTAGSGRTASNPTDARRAISGGATPGITLPSRGATSGVRAGGATGTTATTPAATTGASGSSAADKAKKVLEDIKTYSAYRKQLKDVADVLGNTGDLSVKLGELTFEGAKKCLELTKKLWKKGFWGKLGAIFTGLATGLLYAFGGIFYGLGKLLGWIAWPLKKIAGGDDAKKKAAAKQTDTQKKVDAAKQNAKKKLEDLKKTSAADQSRVMGELARLAGLTGSQALSPAQRQQATALLELAREVGLRIPNLDAGLLDKFPAGEREAVAGLLPGSPTGDRMAA